MPQVFGVGEHRVIYRAVDWGTGLTVTAYLWSPALVKSELQSFTEIEDGLYHLDFDFTEMGAWTMLMYENGVKAGFAVMRVESLLLDVAAGGVWAYATRTLTQTAAEIQAALEGSRITIHRGDDLSVSLTGLGSLAGRTELWFTAKKAEGHVDSRSEIQITEGDGLKRLNGAEGTAGNGSITVDDEDAGDITIVLKAVETAKLRPASLHYDVQVLIAGIVSTLTESRINVTADVTRAVSA